MTPNIIDSILKKQFRLHRGEGIQFGLLPLGFPDCSGSQGLAIVWEPSAPVANISHHFGLAEIATGHILPTNVATKRKLKVKQLK